MAWTYTQNFDALTLGDLNGQDSWAGDTPWDVESSVVLQGTQSVGAAADASVDKAVSRVVTGVTSGTVYISGRQSAATGGARLNIQLLEGATVLCWIRARNTDDTHWDWYHGGTSSTTFATLAINTNYRFGISFDCASDQYQVNIDNGSFTTADTFYNNNTATNVDTIKVYLENGSYNAYFDAISPIYASSTNQLTTLNAG